MKLLFTLIVLFFATDSFCSDIEFAPYGQWRKTEITSNNTVWKAKTPRIATWSLSKKPAINIKQVHWIKKNLSKLNRDKKKLLSYLKIKSFKIKYQKLEKNKSNGYVLKTQGQYVGRDKRLTQFIEWQFYHKDKTINLTYTEKNNKLSRERFIASEFNKVKFK